jgi:hypothetical protein
MVSDHRRAFCKHHLDARFSDGMAVERAKIAGRVDRAGFAGTKAFFTP